ncbi:hypothetical protein HMPREF3164_07050 [Rothia sp. HMSC08A08]|uniref:hypothetical protein n=1 Tax=Rothia dentocariosa TaxID=2047 RepID=UPI0008A4FDCC|nr:hypothetical protein [Rothia dentocariosa]OFS79327.1 hypothetical protein HMPREF3164_07050 [Rothia sp. HMSC08A08]
MESIDDLLHRRIESTVKLLQLPLTDEEIARGVDKLASNIPDGLTGREIDYAYQLETSFTEWNESGVPDSILKDAVRLLLEDTEVSKRGSGFNSDAYFGLLHGLLPEKTAIAGSLSLQTMRRVLSQSLFITSMFVDEEMSCSQVARVLTSTESKYIPSDASSKVASAFKLEPKISKVEAQQIIEFDRAAGEENFPDASLTESYQICERLCQLWVPELSIVMELANLSSPDLRANSYYPYIQILHWATLAVEKYDHPVTYLYEFSPRGAAANTLFGEVYPNVSTQNPFLNLAKAVHQINYAWLENRNESSAYALVNLLQKIDALPYRARKEVSRVIRSWILYFIQLEDVPDDFPQLEIEFDAQIARAFSDAVNSGETYTQGVIEQRLVDALALLAFDKEGVAARGIGDSVNASNLSKKKMGDLEFLNAGAKRSLALEAHGGQVTPGYVHAHLASLARVLELREIDNPELSEEKDEWVITVAYVAHSFSAGLDDLPTEVSGFTIEHEFWSYDKLTQKAFADSSDDAVAEIFNVHVRDALNLKNVRQSTRDKATEILNAVLSARF